MISRRTALTRVRQITQDARRPVGAYAASIAAMRRHVLGSRRSLRVAGPVRLAAVKLEAHGARVGSRDFADLIVPVDGRAEFVAEIEGIADELRGWIAAAVAALLAERGFLQTFPTRSS